ncbi:MAG: SH3 domain-containing protein [Anaerolineae bacterium]
MPTAPVSSWPAIIIATEDEYSVYNLRNGPSSRCPIVGGIETGARAIAHGGWSYINSDRYPTGWRWVLIETEADQQVWVWGVGVRLTEDSVTLTDIPEDDIPGCALSSDSPAETATPAPVQMPEYSPNDPSPAPQMPPSATLPPSATPTESTTVTPTTSTIRGIPRPPTPTPGQSGD